MGAPLQLGLTDVAKERPQLIGAAEGAAFEDARQRRRFSSSETATEVISERCYQRPRYGRVAKKSYIALMAKQGTPWLVPLYWGSLCEHQIVGTVQPL